MAVEMRFLALPVFEPEDLSPEACSSQAVWEGRRDTHGLLLYARCFRVLRRLFLSLVVGGDIPVVHLMGWAQAESFLSGPTNGGL